MWVPDLGLALRVCPGIAPSSGADCSAPGISPCPLRRVTAHARPRLNGTCNVPRPGWALSLSTCRRHRRDD
eukprot:4499276-Prymnesium_polylepis.1